MLALALHCTADSNINPDQSMAWGENIGWINCRPSAAAGADLGEFVCSGFIYSANVGWINLGNGRPANGIHYQNSSAADFGVNRDPEGRLWGLAYGANIGWIHFATNGAPRIDLRTGLLSGSAYGANIGWINLGDANFSLRADSIRGGADSDNDGIPDAWELLRARNLTSLNANTDADRDGVSDLQEYFADTEPLDPGSHLRILNFISTPFGQTSALLWTTRPTRLYRVLMQSEYGSQIPSVRSVSDFQMGNGNPMSVVVTNRSNSLQGFFQIEAIRPLSP
ncbi:MAG: hypothetical protein HYY23_05155 [Verrucomicrobia bacterium]|nr:hypothetical protein [Verrucomicrobiota bacterium]